MSKIQVNEIVNHFDNGAPDCPRGLTVTGVSTFSGNVSIGGTLSYEDVTNIDSVGIITAQAGVIVGADPADSGSSYPVGLNLNASGYAIIRRSGGLKGLFLGPSGSSSYNIRLGTGGEANFTGSVGIATDLSTSLAHPNMDDLQVGNTSGNRGITVVSGSSNFGTLAFGDSPDGSGTDRYGGFIEYYHQDDSLKIGTASQPRITIDSSGRVLIAQTSSLLSYAGLQIAGDADTGAHICLSHKTATPVAGNNIGSVRFTNNAGGIGAIIGVEAAGNWTAGSSYPSRIILATTASGATSPTERIRIGSSGKVGINESSPTAMLDVKGTVTAGAGTDEDLQQWNIGSDNVKAEIKYVDTAAARGMLFGTTTDHVLGFQTNDSEKMRITSGGTVWQVASTSGSVNATRGFYSGFSNSADSQSTGLAMKCLGVGGGSGPFDTGVSVNAGNAGAVALIFATRNTSAGTATDGAVYLMQFYYDGNNTPLVVHLGGDNWVTWGQTAGNNLQASWSGISNYSFGMIMLQ